MCLKISRGFATLYENIGEEPRPWYKHYSKMFSPVPIHAVGAPRYALPQFVSYRDNRARKVTGSAAPGPGPGLARVDESDRTHTRSSR
eukprot:3935933-Rhodomonas_salina.1